MFASRVALGRMNLCTSIDFELPPKSPIRNTDEVDLSVRSKTVHNCCDKSLNGQTIDVHLQFEDATSELHHVFQTFAGILLKWDECTFVWKDYWWESRVVFAKMSSDQQEHPASSFASHITYGNCLHGRFPEWLSPWHKYCSGRPL